LNKQNVDLNKQNVDDQDEDEFHRKPHPYEKMENEMPDTILDLKRDTMGTGSQDKTSRQGGMGSNMGSDNTKGLNTGSQGGMNSDMRPSGMNSDMKPSGMTSDMKPSGMSSDTFSRDTKDLNTGSQGGMGSQDKTRQGGADGLNTGSQGGMPSGMRTGTSEVPTSQDIMGSKMGMHDTMGTNMGLQDDNTKTRDKGTCSNDPTCVPQHHQRQSQ